MHAVRSTLEFAIDSATVKLELIKYERCSSLRYVPAMPGQQYVIPLHAIDGDCPACTIAKYKSSHKEPYPHLKALCMSGSHSRPEISSSGPLDGGAPSVVHLP